MVLVSLKPNEEWAIIIHKGSKLPLPSEIKWHTDIPGIRLVPNVVYTISPDDHLVTAIQKNKHQNWGFYHILYAVNPKEDKLIKVPCGVGHKAIIKNSKGNQDILPGSGPLAAVIRAIHAIRRGVLDLGFVKPNYPTRYQRPWVI